MYGLQWNGFKRGLAMGKAAAAPHPLAHGCIGPHAMHPACTRHAAQPRQMGGAARHRTTGPVF
jgi:hypothetical protein